MSRLFRDNMQQINLSPGDHSAEGTIPDSLLELAAELERGPGEPEPVSGVKEWLSDVEHIRREIILMQQSIATSCGVLEPLIARELVEDALRLHGAALKHHEITVEKHFEMVPRVMADGHKVLQILLNIVRNAQHAMNAGSNRPRRLVVTIHQKSTAFVSIDFKDNGVGIAEENLMSIFSRGFTTKKDGHGFGLHSGAQAAQEMGGKLTVASDGPGKGATFILQLPTNDPPGK